MSFFGVTIETIGNLEPIKGADRIVKATLKGMDLSFVVLKDQFQLGDKCVYIPLDSIVPDPVLEKMGLQGKLGGHGKNRCKTIKLKGTYSQGIATDLSLILDLLNKHYAPTPEQITEFLGITKYDPESKNEIKDTPEQQDRRTKRWPWHKKLVRTLFGYDFTKWLYGKPPGVLIPLNTLGLPVYDIEGCNRYKELTESLMDQPVWITLKIEGQNAAVLSRKGKIYVNQRRFTIEKDKNNPLWQIAQSHGFIDLAQKLEKKFGQEALVYFEAAGSNKGATGISGNIYGFEEYKGFIFDIKIGDRYLNVDEINNVMAELQSPCSKYFVPVLAQNITLREWMKYLSYESLEKAAEQKGVLNKKGNCLEEGIVIHPMVERQCQELGGRLILKYRSKAYLAAKGDDE